MERKGARRGKDAATRTQQQPAAERPAAPSATASGARAAEAGARAAAAPARGAAQSAAVRSAAEPRTGGRTGAARPAASREPAPAAGREPARPAAAASRAPAARPVVAVGREPAAAPGRRAEAAPARARAPSTPPIIEPHAGEAEHRHFPRARLGARFELWREGEGAERSFSASLRSVNVSVSGAFLESSFFLPVGTELRVRFGLEEDAEPVEARALIVREQRDGEASGFGVRFEEFYGQTEVALAKLFLGERLRGFAEQYLQSKRARGLPNELERVVDALAAWELIKATNETDPWRGE